MRLDKMLSIKTPYSRSEIKALLKKEGALVNGALVKRPETKIDYNDSLMFCGKQIDTSEFIYVKMNKPKGILTATKDNRETVVDLLPNEFKVKGIFPVGRLDKDTTGLLLLTNDGALAHELLSPKHHVEKSYKVSLDGKLEDYMIEEFNKGLTLVDGTKLKSADLKILDDNNALITITEGKYHQIKRMFGLYNLGVTALKRVTFGGITLDKDLDFGQSKLLTNNELKMLKNAKK